MNEKQEENKIKRSSFQNLKAQLKKVIWPTGKQVVKNTFATIAFVLIISLALIIFNLVFEFLKTKLWYEPIFGPAEQAQPAIVSGDVVDVDELKSLVEEALSGETTEETTPTEDATAIENSEENTVTE